MHVKRQRGFALMELLLASIVVGVMFAVIMRLQTEQRATVNATQVGNQADGFAIAAHAYYEANSTAMLAAMADGTGASDHCVVNANPTTGAGGTQSNDTTLRTCAFDVDWLKWKKALPNSFDAKAGRNSRWVAIFRSVYDGATQTGDVEMLVVMAKSGATFDAPMAPVDLSTAANAIGAGGGYVPGRDIGVCTAKRATTTYQACGAGKAWTTDLSLFVSPTEMAAFGAALPN